MNMKDLKAKKAQLVKEMRTLADADMTAEQEQRFDALKADLEGIEQRIGRQEYLDDMERRQKPETGEYGREVDQYSLTRAIAGAAGLPGVDHGREREVSEELARRSGRQPQGIFVPMEQRTWTGISTSEPGAGPGSNLIADDFRPQNFIEILRNRLAIKQLGATIMNGLSSKVVIPKGKASATSYWIAENADLTASDLQFQQVTLEPRTCGALTEISRQMLMQRSPDVEQLVKSDFAAILAQAVDIAAINGAGSASDQPLGIFQRTDLNEVDVSAGWTWAKVLEFIEALEVDNVAGGQWLTRPEVVKTFRSTPKETGIFVAEGDPTAVSADYLMDGPNSLAGYPLIATKNTPENQICFGRWSDLILGFFGPMDLLANPFASGVYEKGNIQVRAMLSVDCTVRHPESFCIAGD